MKLLNRKVNVKREKYILVCATSLCTAVAARPLGLTSLSHPLHRDIPTIGAASTTAHKPPGSRPLRTATLPPHNPSKPALRPGAFCHRVTSAGVAKPRGAPPGGSQRRGREGAKERRKRAGGRRRRCAAGSASSRPREGGGSGRAAGRSSEGRSPQENERAFLPRGP